MGALDTVFVSMLHNRPPLPFHQVLHLHLCLRLCHKVLIKLHLLGQEAEKYLEEIIQSSLA